MDFAAEIDLALTALTQAIDLINRDKTSRQVDWKTNQAGAKEMVTDFDVRINACLDRLISDIFPDDLVIGEELRPAAAAKARQRIWFIDPIDGTRSFVNDSRGYAIMLAFAVDGVPRFSIVHDVHPGKTVIARKGHGLRIRLGGKASRFEPPAQSKPHLIWNPYLDHAVKAFLSTHLRLPQLFETESTGLRAVALAEGHGRLFLSLPRSSKIWDSAPAHLIITEAGGQYTDFTGAPLTFRPDQPVNRKGAVATRGIDHQRVLALLNQYPDPF